MVLRIIIKGINSSSANTPMANSFSRIRFCIMLSCGWDGSIMRCQQEVTMR